MPRKALLAGLCVVLLLTVVGGAATALQLYGTLNRAHADARDAIEHLDAVRALLPSSALSGNLTDLATLMKASTLKAAADDLRAADADFLALRVDLAPVGAVGVASHAPVSGDALTAARLLADAGDLGCRAAITLLGDVQVLSDYLNGGIFSSGSHAALTPAIVSRLRSDLTAAMADLNRAVADIQAANLNAIPSSLLKPSDVTLLHTLVSKWPSIQTAVGQAQRWLGVLPAILGIGTPTKYLVEVMDSNELRPGGGFIGNYTVATLTGGTVEPFTLEDVYLLDRPYLSRLGYNAPVPSRYFWWPFPTSFALRDSNLSPDFPTNAKLAIQLYNAESGQSVQGVLAITPATIERILAVVGSIPMPQYGVTVTSTNLSRLIEYYQLGTSPQSDLPPSDQISSPGKRFVALVGRTLLQKLHGLQLAQMAAIGQTLITDVRQKDVQIFLADDASEALLTQTGYSSAVPRGPGDAVTINDANDGVNKANQFVTAAYHDSVSLDAAGNATHTLSITYTFKATDITQLYGPDRYQTYLRIYAPLGSTLKSSSGLRNIFGDDQVGHSDLAWRQMWGGYVVVADRVPYTLRFTWVVPHAATRDSHGHWHYTLDYQRQAGSHQTLTVSISAPGHAKPIAQFSGTLLSDEVMSVAY